MSDYYGDFVEDETVRIPFNTNDAAGVPITLAGTPSIAVYKDGGTTQSTAGCSITVDHDSVTGRHEAVIDTSADAFYATGADYTVQLAAGTVDGTSVVGAVLGHFSVQNRYMRGTDSAATQASVNTIDDFLDTEVAAIKAKTDLIPAGGFPTNFSLLAISGGGAVTDADSGGGSSLTAQEVWEYATRTLSAGTNINGSTFTAIPWNAAWDAEVQSEVADALAVYDPPTNAEMEARTVATAVYATAANLATVDTVVDALAVELAKVPRSGSTFRYTNQDTAATADVTIGAAT